MIKIVAKSLIKEECVEEYVALAKELVEKTNLNDKGMVYYTLNRAAKEKRLFAILEAWESKEDLNAHMASEHFTSIAPKMRGMVEQSFPAEFFFEVE